MQHNNYPKSAFEDFEIIYQSNGTDSMDSNVREAEERLSHKYLLLPLEQRILSCVLHHRIPFLDKSIYAMDIEDVSSEISMDAYVLTNLVKDMVSRGIVAQGTGDFRISFVAVKPEALAAFRTYEPFKSNKCPNDPIQMIKEASHWDFGNKNFLTRLGYVIENCENSSFLSGLKRLKIDYKSLESKEQLLMLLGQFGSHFTEPLVLSVDDDNKEGMDDLVKRGLAIKAEEGYVISPKVAEALFSGNDNIVRYNDISELVQIIKSDDIEKKVLYFSEESQEEIDHLHYVLSLEGFKRACEILTVKQHRNPAIMSLLWGGPGTGKTETVKQIARETGRDVFLFDASKVTASEWGATEKLYQKLFLAYRYIVAVKKVTPILLFNEADQALSRRLPTIERGIDKSENTVSNILLQAFEDMHGILLATTNNIDILDPAFDRRFLFKTELQNPDARARKAIWKTYIPSLTDSEAEHLAGKFEMSGALISNVATQRDLAELYYLGDRGMAYIEGLCVKALRKDKKRVVHKKIGY